MFHGLIVSFVLLFHSFAAWLWSSWSFSFYCLLLHFFSIFQRWIIRLKNSCAGISCCCVISWICKRFLCYCYFWAHRVMFALIQAILAAVVIANLVGLLRQFSRLRDLWGIHKPDAVNSSLLILYSLTSVYVFSLLFSIHFLRCWQGEFVLQSGASLVGYHFLCDSGVLL